MITPTDGLRSEIQEIIRDRDIPEKDGLHTVAAAAKDIANILGLDINLDSFSPFAIMGRSPNMDNICIYF